MRHGLKIHKMGRDAAHRKATLRSLSTSLIEHKRITTTLGKARALRVFVEPILHRAKDPSTASRRQAFSRLGNKEAVKTLYGEIAQAIGTRPGGYTRIVKLGQVNEDGHKRTDAAEMAIIEIVDFNDVQPESGAQARRKTRRSRTRGAGDAAVAASPQAEPATVAPEPVSPEPVGSEPTAPETGEPEAEQAEAPTAQAPADETPEAAPEERSPAQQGGPAEVDPAAEAAHSSGTNPGTTGNPQVSAGASGGSNADSAHGDAEQGAAPGTGDPIPESHKTNIGRSSHRG